MLRHVRPGAAALAPGARLELVYRGESPYDPAALERRARLPEAPTVPVSAVVVEGNAPRTLVAQAGARWSDRIAVGLRGHGALGALHTGSTSDHVLELADRPVRVVPPAAPSPGEFTG